MWDEKTKTKNKWEWIWYISHYIYNHLQIDILSGRKGNVRWANLLQQRPS